MSIAEKLVTIAENQQKVYDTGFAEGIAQGGGGDSWDSFWDFYQVNGTRNNYAYAFAGHSSLYNIWSIGGYTPKYQIKPDNAYGMFQYFGGSANNSVNFTPDFDFKQFLIDNNWELDLTTMVTTSYCFQYSAMVNCPPVAIGNGFYTFDTCKRLKTIDKLIFNYGTTTYTNTFSNCSALEEIYELEGELKANVSFSPCTKLSKETLLRLLNATAQLYSGTKTLTLGSTNLAKLTDEEKAIATNKGWTLA